MKSAKKIYEFSNVQHSREINNSSLENANIFKKRKISVTVQ